MMETDRVQLPKEVLELAVGLLGAKESLSLSKEALLVAGPVLLSGNGGCHWLVHAVAAMLVVILELVLCLGAVDLSNQ